MSPYFELQGSEPSEYPNSVPSFFEGSNDDAQNESGVSLLSLRSAKPPFEDAHSSQSAAAPGSGIASTSVSSSTLATEPQADTGMAWEEFIADTAFSRVPRGSLPRNLGLLKAVGKGEFVGHAARVEPHRLATAHNTKTNTVHVQTGHLMRRYYTSAGQDFWTRQYRLLESNPSHLVAACPYQNNGRRPNGPIRYPNGMSWTEWQAAAAIVGHDETFLLGDALQAPRLADWYDDVRDGLETASSSEPPSVHKDQSGVANDAGDGEVCLN